MPNGMGRSYTWASQEVAKPLIQSIELALLVLTLDRLPDERLSCFRPLGDKECKSNGCNILVPLVYLARVRKGTISWSFFTCPA